MDLSLARTWCFSTQKKSDRGVAGRLLLTGKEKKWFPGGKRGLGRIDETFCVEALRYLDSELRPAFLSLLLCFFLSPCMATFSWRQEWYLYAFSYACILSTSFL